MVPLPQRLFHFVGRFRSAWMLRGFERDARSARSVNAQTLRRILAANRDCEFGRAHSFSTPEAFRSAVPLQTWPDVAPFVDRMARGEANVLCSEPVLFFALSSGTTGASKRIPATSTSFAHQRRYYTGITPAIAASRVPGGKDPHRGITLLSAASATQRTEGGIPVALASANGLARVKGIVPFLWTSPWPVFEVEDLESAWYLHALFGLRERTAKFINAVFAPHLVAWLGFVEARWESLLRDIADGRSALGPLPPDPTRAAELERLVGSVGSASFAGFVPRAWPSMRYVTCVITGPFASAVPRLRHYLGELPIHTTVWAASEGMLGLNIDLDRPERYVLCNGCAHFEFLPLGEGEAIGLAQVDRGRSYEVVLTNEAGLYRYRLGDVVEVVDFHGEAPVVEFRYRTGSVLDLVGEKTSEEQALAAVQQAVGRENLVDYAVWHEDTRYIFYVETRAEVPELEVRLEAALCAANPAYAGYREGGLRLGPVAARQVKAGAFEALERHRLAANPGVARNQMKTPRLLQEAAWREVLTRA